MHENNDSFTDEGTPIYSATPGYVQRIDSNPVVGNIVTVIGGGGVRTSRASPRFSRRGST